MYLNMIHIHSVCSWVWCTGSAMSIRVVIIVSSGGVTIVLTIATPSVECIVEALPLLARLSMVAKLVLSVRCDNLVGCLLDFGKVVADHASDFSTVDQHDEHWLNASVEVLLH